MVKGWNLSFPERSLINRETLELQPKQFEEWLVPEHNVTLNPSMALYVLHNVNDSWHNCIPSEVSKPLRMLLWVYGGNNEAMCISLTVEVFVELPAVFLAQKGHLDERGHPCVFGADSIKGDVK